MSYSCWMTSGDVGVLVTRVRVTFVGLGGPEAALSVYVRVRHLKVLLESAIWIAGYWCGGMVVSGRGMRGNRGGACE